MSTSERSSTTPRGALRGVLRHIVARVALPLAACALVLGFGPVLASDRDQRSIGDTRVFATLPRPGHPFGIAVDTDRVYVSTSRGDFFAQQPNSLGERVFAFDTDGELLRTTSIATMPNATMGLWGV